MPFVKKMCIKLVNYWDKETEMHGQQTSKNVYQLQSSFCVEWEVRVRKVSVAHFMCFSELLSLGKKIHGPCVHSRSWLFLIY